MNVGQTIRCLILSAVFLLVSSAEYADALIRLARTKNVAIDAQWRISARYTHEFEITSPEDGPKLRQILREFAEADHVSEILSEICFPDGRAIPWDPLNNDAPPVGAEIRITAMVNGHFPGFAELFADSLHIDEDLPIGTAAYCVNFPQPTTFACRIDCGGECIRKTAVSDHFNWRGHDVTRLALFISTATSWDQIAQRYQTHFQNRMGKGLPAQDIPDSLRDIGKAGAPDQKIQAVMDFLDGRIMYRTDRGAAHALLPDAPATVLHRGWGDCKDLALLGAALLARMAVPSVIVLSGAPRGCLSDDGLPDPFIFDHALIGITENSAPAYYDCLAPAGAVALNDRRIYLRLEVFPDAD